MTPAKYADVVCTTQQYIDRVQEKEPVFSWTGRVKWQNHNAVWVSRSQNISLKEIPCNAAQGTNVTLLVRQGRLQPERDQQKSRHL